MLGCQIGTWMQTVGAQWMLVDQPDAATLVSLVQTATMLPILLLAVPAGVLADLVDRRRMLIVVQLFQAAAAAVLTLLTLAGQMTPALLLTLTFVLGCGSAVTVPTYSAVIPELVSRDQIPAASALNSISINLARALGPALAGVLVAQAGPTTVFGLNALLIAVFAVTLVLWRRRPDEDEHDPEPFLAALRAGGRYVRHSPAMRRFMLRAALFILPGVALWALLPLVANLQLNMNAAGYGLLLAALGVGAVTGGITMPWLRTRLSDNQLLGAASTAYGAALVVVALVRNLPTVATALVVAGIAWMIALANINAIVQMFLPRWVRARGLGTYQVVFLGGQAIGALLWGIVAENFGLVTTFLTAAALTGAGAATVLVWPLPETRDLDREPSAFLPEPEMAVEPDPSVGPIVVTVSYMVAPEHRQEFVDAMRPVRRVRLRTGAVQWGLFQHGEDPEKLTEVYAVPTWGEHLRQHAGRHTGSDRDAVQRARALSTTIPQVAHLVPPIDAVQRR
jgi:MFS family permease